MVPDALKGKRHDRVLEVFILVHPFAFPDIFAIAFSWRKSDMIPNPLEVKRNDRILQEFWSVPHTIVFKMHAIMLDSINSK